MKPITCHGSGIHENLRNIENLQTLLDAAHSLHRTSEMGKAIALFRQELAANVLQASSRLEEMHASKIKPTTEFPEPERVDSCAQGHS